MAGTSTPNYQFYKADPNDNVNVEQDIDANWDKADTELFKLANPPVGKIWRTGGFQPLPANPGVAIDFEAGRVRNGMTLGAGNNGLVLPLDGFYEVTLNSYYTGGAAYQAMMNVVRVRAATADKPVGFISIWKESGDDYQVSFSDEFPLKAGDELRCKGESTGGVGSTWGTNESSGTRLLVTYKGPLGTVIPV